MSEEKRDDDEEFFGYKQKKPYHNQKKIDKLKKEGRSCGECIDGWVEISPGQPKIPCGKCDRA